MHARLEGVISQSAIDALVLIFGIYGVDSPRKMCPNGVVIELVEQIMYLKSNRNRCCRCHFRNPQGPISRCRVRLGNLAIEFMQRRRVSDRSLCSRCYFRNLRGSTSSQPACRVPASLEDPPWYRLCLAASAALEGPQDGGGRFRHPHHTLTYPT